jgi:hypothetical protein
MRTSPGSDRKASDAASRPGVAGLSRQRAGSGPTGGRGERRFLGRRHRSPRALCGRMVAAAGCVSAWVAGKGEATPTQHRRPM